MEAAMRVIVNPVAANGALGKKWPQVRDLLQAEGGQFDASLTEGPNHATDLVREALSAGYRTIVAVGGDGTLHPLSRSSPKLYTSWSREKH